MIHRLETVGCRIVGNCDEASTHIFEFEFDGRNFGLFACYRPNVPKWRRKKGFFSKNTYAFYRNPILNIEHLLCPTAF